MLELLRAGLEQGRRWFRPVIDTSFGVVAWLRGEFAVARSHLEAATADHTAVDQHEIDAVWFLPEEPIALARIYLALVGLVRGDLVGADADLAQAARRAEQLGFPQGAWSLAYARCMEGLVCIEAGRLDRAGALAADLREQAERHGFDQWQLAGANQEATVSALAALGADDVDQTALAAHIATITTLLDTFRTLEVNMFSTFYDAVLGRLLIAASQPEQARARLDTGLQLAEDTGMHFYDAELLRLRAHTHTDPEARRADLGAALDLARRQGATLFELRTALDDFELRGEPARVAVVDAVVPFPADSELPELARARASLLKRSPRICDRPRRHALQQGVEP